MKKRGTHEWWAPSPVTNIPLPFLQELAGLNNRWRNAGLYELLAIVVIAFGTAFPRTGPIGQTPTQACATATSIEGPFQDQRQSRQGL